MRVGNAEDSRHTKGIDIAYNRIALLYSESLDACVIHKRLTVTIESESPCHHLMR